MSKEECLEERTCHNSGEKKTSVVQVVLSKNSTVVWGRLSVDQWLHSSYAENLLWGW